MKDKKAVRKPISIWFEVEAYSVKINPIEVVALTEHFVTYLERGWDRKDAPVERRRKRDYSIWPTFAEAKEYAVRRAKDNVCSLKAQLQTERSELGQWETLKEKQ